MPKIPSTIIIIIIHSNIRLKRKCRHALMNMCFGFLNLVMFFAGGINRTEPQILCRIVGIGIHYFSICCLLWMGINVRNLYKGMSRKERSLPPGEPIPPPRPILRFYFVGWGKRSEPGHVVCVSSLCLFVCLLMGFVCLLWVFVYLLVCHSLFNVGVSLFAFGVFMFVMGVCVLVGVPQFV